jgi:hypothetical protein
MTLSSRPILYQGDEWMQHGWKWKGNPSNHPTEPGDGSRIYDETLREPFQWYQIGNGPGQTSWFAPRFDKPNDGVSKEEQEQSGGMLDLTRGLAHLRARHPALANGDLGTILSDTQDWMVFEKFSDTDRYLILINMTSTGHDYRFHEGWYPRYVGAHMIYWSDGAEKKWKDVTASNQKIEGAVFVPPFGLVVLRQVTNGS